MLSAQKMEKRIRTLFGKINNRSASIEEIIKGMNTYTLTTTDDFYIVGINDGEVYIPIDKSKNKLLPVEDNFIFWASATFTCSYRVCINETPEYPKYPQYKITGRLV